MTDFNPLKTKQWLALLATLFVIVLIAHLAIITSATGIFGIKKTEKIPSFATRMIALPAIVPVAEKVPEVVPSQKSTKSPQPQNTDISVKTKAVEPLATSSAHLLPDLSHKPTETAIPSEPLPLTVPLAAEPTIKTPQTTPSATEGDSTTPPPAFVALDAGLHTYKVNFTRNGISNQGNAEVRWRNDGDKYTLNLLATYTLLFKTFNVFEQNSTGQITPTGLQPQRFSDKRLNRSEVAAHFNYASEKISFSVNKPEMPLLAGAQDRASVIWQLAGLLAADPARYPPGSIFTVQTVSSSDAEPWLFTVNEPETLNLTSGSHIALRLTRNPRREFDQKIELWFATSLNYLPVRFRFTETNGDYVDAVWQSAQSLPSALF